MLSDIAPQSSGATAAPLAFPALVLGAAPSGRGTHRVRAAQALQLQRVHGNRHVSRLLHQAARSPQPARLPSAARPPATRRIQRWDSPEHVALGDTPRGPQSGLILLDCHRTDLPQRTRPVADWPPEWQALHAGGTPAQQRALAEGLTYGEVVALSGDFYQGYEALNRAPLREIYDLIPLIRGGASTGQLQEATGGRYLALAAENESHFSNVRPGHRNMDHWWRGHAAAIMAARRGDANTAWEMNAAADHFLTDAFSGGHIRVPRHALHARGTMGDVEAKILHDLDNEHGVEVDNARHDGPWIAFGDDFLADPRNARNRTLADEAVQLSKQDIADALAQGHAYPEPAAGTDFAAERLVPHAVDPSQDRWSGRTPTYVPGPDGTPIRVADDYTMTRDRVILSEGPDVVAGLTNDDNQVREWVTRQDLAAIGRQSVADKVRMIEVLLNGPSMDDDEAAILRLLRASAHHGGDLVAVVNRVNAHELMGDFHGAEEDELRTLLQAHYYGRTDQATALRLIVLCIDGATGEWEEEMIVDLLEAQPNGRAIIEQVGRRTDGAHGADRDFNNGLNELEWQLDGADQERLESLFGASD